MRKSIIVSLALVASMTVATAWFSIGCEASNKDVASDVDSDTDTDGDADCDEGEFSCLGNDYMECVDGEWALAETCEEVCVDYLGCVSCVPGDTYCEEDVVMMCDDQGSGYYEYQDCEELGTVCDEGECYFADPCDQADALESNIGCEYWAVDLDNSENFIDDAAAGQFAVAVANIGSNGPADVEVHINNAAQGEALDLQLVESHTIAETELYIFLLPRRDADGDNITDNVDDGPQSWLSSRAFRITSSVPVVAYQFNTLDQQFSNDASLLLPTSGLGQDHLVVGYPPGAPTETVGSPKNRGYVTILGSEEDTEVTVTVTEDIQEGVGVPAIAKGESHTFYVGPFDVLNLETRFFTIMELASGHTADLTGTRVVADKPVAVFFGVDMTGIGQSDVYPDSCCAEHIEQQIIPSKAMGQNFVVSHSGQRNSGTAEMDYYRIMAYETATVTTNLPAPDDSFTLAAGEYHDFFVNHGFTVQTTDGYLHVAQYLVESGNTTAGVGDAALLYVPAVEQRRGLYVFTTGQGFSENHAVISMPTGANVHYTDGTQTLDVNGTNCLGPLDNGTIDSIDYVAYDCPIQDGVHMAYSGDSPEENEGDIAVFVYGYYYAGSYAYPAGSDLRHTNPVVVE